MKSRASGMWWGTARLFDPATDPFCLCRDD
jgi:hypothetical protein